MDIKEVKLSGDKTYISPHEGFTLSFLDGSVKKKYKFENGRLLVSNPSDIALIDAEYDRRYLKKDENGDPVLDANGNKQYSGEMKFIPIDEYEKSRLLQPVIVKTKSGKTYKITEGDLINLAESREAGTPPEQQDHSITIEVLKQAILDTMEEIGVDADQEVIDALTKNIYALYGPPTDKTAPGKPKGKPKGK